MTLGWRKTCTFLEDGRFLNTILTWYYWFLQEKLLFFIISIYYIKNSISLIFVLILRINFRSSLCDFGWKIVIFLWHFNAFWYLKQQSRPATGGGILDLIINDVHKELSNLWMKNSNRKYKLRTVLFIAWINRWGYILIRYLIYK